MLASLTVLAVAVLVVVALAAVDDDEESTAAAGDTAPIAPDGPLLLPSCASDMPTEGREATEDRTVKLPSPSPDRYAATAPERALAEFLDAWRDRAFDRMALWTAPSWRALTPDAADQGALLRRRYANYRLLGWTVLGEGRGDGPAVRRYRVLVAYRDVAPRVQRERLAFVVNRENAEGELVRQGGRWGIFLPAAPDARPDSGVPAEGCTTATRQPVSER